MAGEDVPWAPDDDRAPRRGDAVREVDFDTYGGVMATHIVDRRSLVPGERRRGPVIVEEVASTTLVLPGQEVWCDDAGNLVIGEVA